MTDAAEMHTCYLAKNTAMPFASLMSARTDIHEHLITLYMISVENHCQTIVELGVRDGQSTIALLCAAREVGGQVHSFDKESCQEARKSVSKLGLESHWVFTQTDDLDARWSEPIDHLFIDTSHTFEHTLRELVKYEPFVTKEGVITMHDSVTSPDVKRAAGAYFKGRSDVRMYEYLNNHGLLIICKK